MLLALIMLAAITAAGIGAAVLIVTQFNVRVATDNGIMAFYAADSGIERSLFTIFNNRLANADLGITCDAAATPYYGQKVCTQVASNNPPMASLLNNASLSLSKTTLFDGNNSITIVPNQTVTYDFSSLQEHAPPRTIVFSAPDLGVPNCDLTCMKSTPGVIVKWTYQLRGYQGSAVPDTSPANTTERIFSFQNVKYGIRMDLFTGTPTPNSAAEQNLTIQNPSGVTDIPSTVAFNNISGWLIRVTAPNKTINNFQLLACTGTSDCTTIPAEQFSKSNSISVMAQGTVGGSSVTLNAKVPWNIPASGIFDYALFSEQSLLPN